MEELSPVKKALLEVRNLRARLETLEGRQREPIAVVGVGLRLPGEIDSPQAFWQLLAGGVDAVGEVPPERWDNAAYYDPDFRTPGKLSTRFGSFLQAVDKFDPAFFGISPREAESMDPQHRLLLEVAWEALERAGQSPAQLAGKEAGVFLGISNSDYQRLMLSDIERIDPYVSTGNLFSVAAGRLSYTLGLHGPNLAVDTACSSSLVAVHLAVQSLRGGECDLALVGGVNLMLSPAITVNFSKAQMMAPDGRCKTFDAAADGYVRGEGCIVIVLKRLADALADRSPILGVVRGTAINHDGRSGGLTAPNGPAQTAVIRAALANGGVQPHQVAYVETHGTGTALGDPIEVTALLEALAKDRAADNPLLLGSVKTNLGHLEAAAGLAGLVKVLLALQERRIPPHLHLRTLNPHITLDGYAAAIPTKLTPWPARTSGGAPQPRLAGVSSFGLSGTNAHIILEEAPLTAADDKPAAAAQPLQVLPLSAQTPNALRELAGRYAAHLRTQAAGGAAVDLADVCYTAGAGRSHFNQRLALVARDAVGALARLEAFVAERAEPGIHAGQAPAGVQPDITFLYTGHGGNYVGMGRQLYLHQPVFRAALDECDALTRPLLEHPLLSALYPDLPNGASSPADLLEQMTYAQVALFSLQYALTQLWQSWGVRPALVMGHSAGEYAAAAAAGVFSLQDSLKLVLARGQLMESPAMDGVMAAVFADAERVAPLLAPYAGEVAIAGYNGPNNVVISGATAAVQHVLQALAAAHIKSRRLPINQAAHSPLLDGLLDAFERQVSALAGQAPYLGLVSSVTGQLASAAELTSAAYWRAHLRQPVRFQQAMATLHGLGQRIFVEIGPRPMLIALGRRCLPDDGAVWAASLNEGGEDGRQMADSLALLYTRGVPVAWDGVHGGPRRRVELPTYPFQRKRYWTSITPATAQPASQQQADAGRVFAALCTAGELQSAQAPLDLAVGTYAAKWEALRRLSSGYIVHALQELGALRLLQSGACTPAELAAELRILPAYTGLFRRWLRRLVAEGVLTADAACIAAPHPLPSVDLAALRAEAEAQLAGAPMLFDYVERCGPRLAAVLTGALPGLETLFPGGSPALAEAIYQEWAGSRYYANLMRGVLQTYVAERGPQPLRVLEVGAGTGATTAALLPILPADRTQYMFTDVSDLFLSRAAAKFAAYPFLRFGRLDLEQPPAGQAYAPGSCHVIVATNVLHATADLHATLDRVRDLLAPGGLLLINEVTEHLAWYDITTGLIEGWQRFDDDLRQDQPLLDAATWERTLAQHGFAAVAAWPAAGSAPAVLGQHVIAALKPSGVSEQPEGEAFAHPVTHSSTHPLTVAPDDAAPAVDSSPAALRRQLQDAVPDERDELLFAFVGSRIRQVLRLEAGAPLERGNRLLDLGLDSLMALELRRLLAAGIGLPEDDLSATLVFDYPTVGAIVEHLAGQVAAQEPPPAEAGQPAPAAPTARTEGGGIALQAADVAAMSDAEVEALLLARLSKHG